VPRNKPAPAETNGSRRMLAPMSLRMRMAFGIGAVVLPVLLLAAVASVASRTTLAGFETAASSAAEEAIPLAKLEAELLVARAAGYDDVFDGAAGGAGFDKAVEDVDRRFRRLLRTEGLDDEHVLVLSAERSWIGAVTIVESARSLSPADRLVEMERADVFYRAADDDLAAAERAAVAEQSKRLSDARALDTRTQRTALVLLAAAVIAAVVAAFNLIRSLLRPLDMLKHGASRLRQRDLKHRVRVERNDELGEVAEGFNRMAEEIERIHRVLLQRALLDPLTKLGNRALLMDRVGHALARRDHDGVLALLMIDLDGFKAVNDRHGHLSGDQVLADVAERVKSCLRGQDSASRLGGDEFAVLLEDLESPDGAVDVAQRINHALLAPFRVGDEQVTLSASIGIALGRPDSTVDSLLGEADLAMYRVKRAGKNGFTVAHPALSTSP